MEKKSERYLRSVEREIEDVAQSLPKTERMELYDNLERWASEQLEEAMIDDSFVIDLEEEYY